MPVTKTCSACPPSVEMWSLSCNYTSAKLTQFDGRARGDDVMGNLTDSKLCASQVTVGMLDYRCCADSQNRLLVNSCSFMYADAFLLKMHFKLVRDNIVLLIVTIFLERE